MNKAWPIGAAVVALIVTAFNFSNILNSNIYQRTFRHADYEQRQRDITELVAKLDKLNRMECAIQVEARQATLQIEIERNILTGMNETRAIRNVNHEFEMDVRLCVEHGISPYTKQAYPNG